MDQSRSYWIQKDRTCLNSHVLSSFGDSWEEQAFAEDAAGPLGGCIWPPRSYTCSFCRREFRSAQALGGHMNVHRRDRARLKQISSPKANQVLEPNSSLSRCMLQNPNEICNPNFDLDHTLFSSSSPRPSTVSILTPFTCSFAQEDQKGSTPVLSWSKFESRKRFHLDDLGNQDKSCTKVLEANSTTSKKSNHQIEVHFSGNLNSLVRRRCETPIYNDKDEPNDGLFSKRRRTDDDAHSFFAKNSDTMVNGDEAESLLPVERSPNSTLENLDLELRLGDRPK
ncbi:uncharacterized protein LOC112513471 [Cynara cardunculus var. scolymus]|uniref:Zinc finger, C2H2 n=1 Tax=Cynara cardunculus var. scolymus TaxID=59895 RepID=A0A103Y6E0_CYNCS|nr:uncharacterized protein LOC112513471 [Cynara cardunculus var. scolymus]KVI03357.1 Zinc finger, C2H2 [Cynara cardunculus var. scolymus]